MMKALKKKRAKGFTLIELIVVIAILGILAAIAVPRFANVSTGAQAAADQATVRTLNSAVALHIANGNSPDITAAADKAAALLILVNADLVQSDTSVARTTIGWDTTNDQFTYTP